MSTESLTWRAKSTPYFSPSREGGWAGDRRASPWPVSKARRTCGRGYSSYSSPLPRISKKRCPGVVSFERTFPSAGRIAGRIEYTGYVVDAAPAADGGAGHGEVILSAGGGAVGAGLLEAAIRAKPLTSLRDRTWRVLAGDNLPGAEFRALAKLVAGGTGIELERSRPDFTTLLANCALSVSQAWYNTLMEIVSAGARAVVVPFAGGHETEQTLRARCFAGRGLLELVDQSALTPETLAAAIDLAARKPRPSPGAINLDGAQRSAASIVQLAMDKAP